ncbi:rCG60830, partial [Rattus norvegicus]
MGTTEKNTLGFPVLATQLMTTVRKHQIESPGNKPFWNGCKLHPRTGE